MSNLDFELTRYPERRIQALTVNPSGGVESETDSQYDGAGSIGGTGTQSFDLLRCISYAFAEVFHIVQRKHITVTTHFDLAIPKSLVGNDIRVERQIADILRAMLDEVKGGHLAMAAAIESMDSMTATVQFALRYHFSAMDGGASHARLLPKRLDAHELLDRLILEHGLISDYHFTGAECEPLTLWFKLSFARTDELPLFQQSSLRH